MKSKAEILKDRTKVGNKKRLIYFLIDKENIVYVGKTESGLKRVFQHDTDKMFDAFTSIEINPSENINDIETDYILQFTPKYNKKVTPDYYESDKYISRLQAKQHLCVDKRGVNFIIKHYKVKEYSKQVINRPDMLHALGQAVKDGVIIKDGHNPWRLLPKREREKALKGVQSYG